MPEVLPTIYGDDLIHLPRTEGNATIRKDSLQKILEQAQARPTHKYFWNSRALLVGAQIPPLTLLEEPIFADFFYQSPDLADYRTATEESLPMIDTSLQS